MNHRNASCSLNLDAPVHGKTHLHDVQSERCVAWNLGGWKVVDLKVLIILDLTQTNSSVSHISQVIDFHCPYNVHVAGFKPTKPIQLVIMSLDL